MNSLQTGRVLRGRGEEGSGRHVLSLYTTLTDPRHRSLRPEECAKNQRNAQNHQGLLPTQCVVFIGLFTGRLKHEGKRPDATSVVSGNKALSVSLFWTSHSLRCSRGVWVIGWLACEGYSILSSDKKHAH